MDIERRYIGKMTNYFSTIFGNIELQSIEQYYTFIGKVDEIRYRMTRGAITKSIKMGRGLAREESETPITADEYEEHKKNGIGHYIEKERLRIPIGEVTIDIDVFSQPRTTGWAIINVCFSTDEALVTFSFPPGFDSAFSKIRDVTDDGRFKNKSIALIGFPTFMDVDE